MPAIRLTLPTALAACAQFKVLVRKARLLPPEPSCLFTLPAPVVHSLDALPAPATSADGVQAALARAMALLASAPVPATAAELALLAAGAAAPPGEAAYAALRAAVSGSLRRNGASMPAPASVSQWAGAAAEWAAALAEAAVGVDPLEAGRPARSSGARAAGVGAAARGEIAGRPVAERCREAAVWLGGCAAPELTQSEATCREAADLGMAAYTEVRAW